MKNFINILVSYLNKKSLGFTLIELMVVIAIIAVLVGIVVVAIDPVQLIGESNDAKKRQELQQMKNALQLYFNDNTAYPTDSSGQPAGLTTTYMRSLPDSFADGDAVYDDVPSGEYRAAVDLADPNADDNDTYAECGGAADIPAGWAPPAYDYFICPD